MATTHLSTTVIGMVAATQRRRITRRPPSANVSRPPVLLEFTQNVINAGYVGQARAKHIVPLPADLSHLRKDAAAEIYRVYAPSVQKAFHLLGQDPKERKVLVLYDGGLDWPRAWQNAIARVLEDAGTKACAFHPTIKMVPFVFPTVETMLVVQIMSTEAHCIVHAEGRSLDYTYQVSSQPLAKKGNMDTVSDCRKQQAAFLLPSGPSDLVTAILKCLEACPVEKRKAAIHNMVFVGALYDPSFGTLVAKKVRDTLQERVEEGTSTVPEEEPAESTASIEWISLPVNKVKLQPLCDHCSVIELNGIRHDVVAWLGASAWANFWHGKDPDAAQFQWLSLVSP